MACLIWWMRLLLIKIGGWPDRSFLGACGPCRSEKPEMACLERARALGQRSIEASRALGRDGGPGSNGTLDTWSLSDVSSSTSSDLGSQQCRGASLQTLSFHDRKACCWNLKRISHKTMVYIKWYPERPICPGKCA